MSADAFLFDLGNVIVSVDFGRAFQSWGRAARVPPQDIAARFRVDAAYEAHERGELSDNEYFAALRRTLGLQLADEAFLEGWNAILLDPLPGMPQLLARLAQATPLYLFSNTNAAHHARWRRQYAEVLAPFREVFCSYQLGARKPGVEAFRRVAERIGLPPERIVFFDDLHENVEGARLAGMQAFHVPSVEGLVRTLASELRISLHTT